MRCTSLASMRRLHLSQRIQHHYPHSFPLKLQISSMTVCIRVYGFKKFCPSPNNPCLKNKNNKNYIFKYPKLKITAMHHLACKPPESPEQLWQEAWHITSMYFGLAWPFNPTQGDRTRGRWMLVISKAWNTNIVGGFSGKWAFGGCYLSLSRLFLVLYAKFCWLNQHLGGSNNGGTPK